MQRWKVTLVGCREFENGDVVTNDGEIIGTWSSDENDIYSFTPNGQEEPVHSSAFLGLFCSWVTKWHENQ
jgi:hypothetical protein